MKNIFMLMLVIAFPTAAFATTYTNATSDSSESHAPSMGTYISQPGSPVPVASTKSGIEAQPSTIVVSSESLEDGNKVLNSNSQFTPADRILAASIKHNLANNNELGQIVKTIEIVANDGRVTLSGTVNSETLRRGFADQIEKMAGVTSIDNQLRVKM